MITSYDDRAQKVEGQLAYDRVRGFTFSKKSSGVIPFGRIVSLVPGSDDQVVVGGTGKAIGFALRDHGQGMNESNVGQYEDKKSVSVIDKDFVIASTVSTAGDYGDTIFFDTSDGTIVVAGTPSATIRPIGYLAQTLTAAGLCKVYVDSYVVKIPFEVTTLASVTGASGAIGLTWDALVNQDNAQAIEVTSYHASNYREGSALTLPVTSAGCTLSLLSAGSNYVCTVRILYKDGSRSVGVSVTETAGS